MVEGTLFIGAVIVAVTEFLKRLYDHDSRGALLIVVAGVVGALVAGFHTQLGVGAISVAQGVLAGLAAAGVFKLTQNVG